MSFLVIQWRGAKGDGMCLRIKDFMRTTNGLFGSLEREEGRVELRGGE